MTLYNSLDVQCKTIGEVVCERVSEIYLQIILVNIVYRYTDFGIKTSFSMYRSIGKYRFQAVLSVLRLRTSTLLMPVFIIELYNVNDPFCGEPIIPKALCVLHNTLDS